MNLLNILANYQLGIDKAVCSKEGIIVNGVVINKNLVAQWLERLSGHDWSEESMNALLNPKDPQNVGRAVKLLCLIAIFEILIPQTSRPQKKIPTAPFVS